MNNQSASNTSKCEFETPKIEIQSDVLLLTFLDKFGGEHI